MTPRGRALHLGGVASDSCTLLLPAALAMVIVAAPVVAVSAPPLLSLLRRPRGRALVRQVHEAVPEAVLHSDGGVEDLHWVTPWLDTLDEVGKRGRPALVLLRRPEVIDRLPDASTLPDARVALNPANTGARDARCARAHEKVLALLAEAGRPHATAGSSRTDLHAGSTMSDVLDTDVTSLIPDFLASGKPYVGVDSTDLSAAVLRERFPSSAGTAVVGRDPDGLEAATRGAEG